MTTTEVTIIFTLIDGYVRQFSRYISDQPKPVPGGYEFRLKSEHAAMPERLVTVFLREIEDSVHQRELIGAVRTRIDGELRDRELHVVGNKITR